MEETTGIVFDIQRCSMNDGPGIRTTVFLKGCPLSCQWCHNPESQSFKPQLGFFADKCTFCKMCVRVCEASVHVVDKDKAQHKVNHSKCSACGKCIEVCPTGALKLYGKRYSVREIMDIVFDDMPYYNQTGGGITLSGGEPLAQIEFAKELLIASKAEGIHTCIETSGYTIANNVEEILPYTDYFLYDYKVTDEALHRSYVGGERKLILDNLKLIYDSGKKIMLRCPIIPGINDNQAHYDAINELKNQYPKLEGVEFLPYHAMGIAKAKAIGKVKPTDLL